MAPLPQPLIFDSLSSGQILIDRPGSKLLASQSAVQIFLSVIRQALTMMVLQLSERIGVYMFQGSAGIFIWLKVLRSNLFISIFCLFRDAHGALSKMFGVSFG